MTDNTADLLSDTEQLLTIGDFMRWGASRFREANLTYGHGTDRAVDDACWLIAHALHLELPLAADVLPCRLTPSEKRHVVELLQRRVRERRPAAYLTGQAWFAGLEFAVSEAVMIPRSPIAELIEQDFEPWLQSDHIGSVLDLCTGSGCIGLATAVHLPEARVDLADLSEPALTIAKRNLKRLTDHTDPSLADRVRVIKSDLFSSLHDGRYDLILSNPPYVGRAELEQLPPEYRHEPVSAFASGELGLDIVLRILHDAPYHLNDHGAIIVEVGNTATVLAEHLPRAPFVWLEFEHGGDGVFLLHREQLIDYHGEFSQAIAAL